MIELLGALTLIGTVSWFQAIMFTWQSRARNQNDVSYFRKANLAAQSTYYIHQSLLTGTVWLSLKHNSPIQWLLTGIVFVLASNHAGMYMVRHMISQGR